MHLGIKEIKRLHDKAYTANQVTRERAADDLVFYWVTQWDDNFLEDTQLAYRGEFDILRKAGRNIIADLTTNPIQVDFEPEDDSREDAAEILDGMYRSDLRHNTSIEAFNNADQENIVCGYGAWVLRNEYKSSRNGKTEQVINRYPIYEANNCVYFDPNAKLMDKSDAEYVSVLTSYSDDGYLDLVEELTGERPDSVNADSFKDPQQSYTFPWIMGEQKLIYVTEFYHRKKVKTKIVTLSNPFGMTTTVDEDALDEKMDDLISSGYEIVSDKTIERYRITKYICDGKQILNGEEGETVYDEECKCDCNDHDCKCNCGCPDCTKETEERTGELVPGEHIPVVPVYGERAYVEGSEHWEGVTRLAKDPQRLRNFQLSYLADIVARSPREKPIFFADQIKGYESMYNITGADNNYPYLLMNRVTTEGEDLPPAQLGSLPAPNIPPALVASIGLSRQAVEDVANPGIPQDIADPDLSGKAVLALQARMDKQSSVYQEHRKHAQRRDGEIYASMAAEVYDVPRDVKIELPDGTRKSEKIMETILTNDGEIVTIKDLNNAEFNVYSKITTSYDSQKEQTLDRLDTMMVGIAPGDPLREILMLKSMELMDGVNFDDVRDYSKNKLLLMGIRKPQTPEEEQTLAQANQQQDEPSAEMVLAMAEDKKGTAALMKEQREGQKMQLTYQTDEKKLQISGFEAQTKRMDTQIDAQEAGAKINQTQIESLGKKLDNQAKIIELRQPVNMSAEEIMQELLEG